MSAHILPDYSLTGVTAAKAVEKGLAEADWYVSPVPRAMMLKLLERRNGPALRDTAIWLGLLFSFGYWAYAWWGSAWDILPFALYGVIYGTTSDSRWHESSHGTAFKSDWMNNALYELASFMVMREATVWRWSHNRHHSDTIIVGRDPEIAVPRPPSMSRFFLTFLGIPASIAYFKTVFIHCTGRLTPDERTFIPESEFAKVIWKARLYALIYTGVIGLSLYHRSILPLLYIGLPNFYGAWLMPVYGNTQHAGLAENVLDHRLNCRTVYMNPLNRFLYWNMNYHVEHHMFPLVPYHALPALHELVKNDMPKPYGSIWEAWCELFPAVWRQRKDPAYHVKRTLPPPAASPEGEALRAQGAPDAEGWMEIGNAECLGLAEAMRLDYGKKTYAIYRDGTGAYYATDGICTHGNTHLGNGLVIGQTIECPKHNGRFQLADGSPARAPICRGLATYPVESRDGRLFINITKPGGAGARTPKTFQLRVVGNRSVATFIKELVIEPVEGSGKPEYAPGDYLQIQIPPYEKIRFSQFEIPMPYAAVWEAQHLFDLESAHSGEPRWNNYSLASNPATESTVRFNVRIAMPPPGQDCPPGVGSSYVFHLKPGDLVTAIGPFGDFHIKPTQKEMVYIGGGAGMAPLRSHISHLFDTEKTARKVSFWYGARSLQETYYREYFQELENQFPNFSFHLALSAPQPEDDWNGPLGFIHQVALEQYLQAHPNLKAVEFYLCGPPMMIKACSKMLADLGVNPAQIAFDEF